MMKSSAIPELVGLDWGTSSLRGYLFGPGGVVLDVRSRPWGVERLPGGDFAAAFADLVGDWFDRGSALPAIASGMVGSRHGWREAGSIDCPADASRIGAGLVTVETSAGPLHIVPGLAVRGDFPDVMRGEETQIAGALEADPFLAEDTVFVLPGTHSKWVAVRGGVIERFVTVPTGELFAAIRDRTILGRPAREAGVACDAAPAASFARGVRAARDSGPRGMLARLFSVRTLHLAGDLAAAETLDYLSGLLIGEEIRCMAAAADGLGHATPVLVGDPDLCGRYRAALAEFGRPAARVVGETVAGGLWRIAHAAGLVGRGAQPRSPAHA